ncbi:MAG: cation diffusion facilitator family transporter [Helicobacteraceae bacterium]|jgi:cation diffusion facilitator family transporter|nr:cation diffusion facilitator family transporter [Helicobacteraceae bacterium]
MNIVKIATISASLTAFVLVAAKLVTGLATGSMAVVSSAVDSLLDMAISLFNLYAVKTSEKKPDEEFNYGRGKIEGLAALFEALLIAASGAFIIWQSAQKLIAGEEIDDPDSAIFVMIFSAVATLALVIFLSRVAKATNSLIVKSDLLHYKSDLWTNIGIIAAIGIIWLTGWHFIDGAISIVIACFIIFGAFKIAKEGVFMLLDHAIEEPLLSEILRIIESAPNSRSHHYLRTRRSANVYVVDCHIVFNETISLREAHDASDYVEEAIAALKPEAKWLITIHLDPRNDSVEEEEVEPLLR